MTVEEKRHLLLRHCEESECENCKLKGVDDCWITIAVANEPQLDVALDIINAPGDLKEDTINRPAHYTDGKIETIEFIEDKKLGFCLGNAIKYISRAGKKDPTKEIEDLKKAEWYIKRRIKELEEANQ